MKQIRIKLTDEQKKALAGVEKKIAKLRGGPYAIFAQIHYPDGEAAVIFTAGQDAQEIHKLLRRAFQKK